jgi:hypothetical protein
MPLLDRMKLKKLTIKSYKKKALRHTVWNVRGHVQSNFFFPEV